MGGLVLCLTGDVMTGRGVDQILPSPGDPRLWERYVDDARTYVELAETASGPIPAPVDFAWPWGEALPVMDQIRAGPPRDQPGDQHHDLRRRGARQGGPLPDAPGQHRLPHGRSSRRLRARQQPRPRPRRPRPRGDPRRPDRSRPGTGGRRTRQRGGMAAARAHRRRQAGAALVGRRLLQRHTRHLGGRKGPARSGVRRRPVTRRRRRPLRPRASHEATGRHRRRVRPLGLELGVRRPARPDPLRPLADRRRGGHRTRTLFAPSAPDRGLPRSPGALRVRRPGQRLRGHLRPRAVSAPTSGCSTSPTSTPMVGSTSYG